MRRMVTVSLEADPQYKRAFAQVAEDEGKDEGELVRLALDAMFGNKIANWQSIFFRKNEPHTVQSNLEGVE